jgi:phosphotransferase system enzyme I (PtsP)
VTATASVGWGAPEPPAEPRRGAELGGARRLLRRLVEVVAEPITPEQRLDRIVSMIASNLVAEVCSVYAQRAGDVLELFATEGLAREAVHRVRMRVGEGLVGTIAGSGGVINTADAQSHPNFRYFPETREESYLSFLGVPILRAGKVVGVLTVQNRARRLYSDDEIEAMQIIASVLAEMFASGNLVDIAKYGDVTGIARGPRRLEGRRLVEGVATGTAVLHEPRVEVTRLLADDPVLERERVESAMRELRTSLDGMLARADLGAGEHREVLEAYRMFARDGGWLRRIREAIDTGLSAEAAVRRVQEQARLRIGRASDPLMRERLLDLDDLANRLLRHLAGRPDVHQLETLPPDAVIVARNLSAAELVEYDRTRLRGVVLEEGSATAHVTIVARAFDIPVVGRVEAAMNAIDAGDPVALDGDHGVVIVRAGEDVMGAFARTVQVRAERRRAYEAERDVPSVTADGIAVSLAMNAAFLADLTMLERSGAEGVGLFRTELSFLTRTAVPNVAEQAAFYAQVLDLAGGRPVVFRTLDIGSDKQVPFWRMPEEENPAMGWRALRIALDRPAVLRAQLRALVRAAAGRELNVMFPMVAEVAELEAARRLLDLELARAAAAGGGPRAVAVGAMLEVPALLFQLDALLPRIDFLSIGSNDLVQFLFAADRGNPSLADRYDTLSPPVLTLLRDLATRCRAEGVRLGLCGEMASRPLEAMALVALGVRHLSLVASEIGPIKAMIRTVEAAQLRGFLERQLAGPGHSLREALRGYASDHGVVMPGGPTVA